MTISEQSKAVLAKLNELVQTAGGRAFIAADEIDCIEQLRSKPGLMSLAVLWVDEEPFGDYPELGRVLRTFKVVASRARSLKLQPGESLVESAAGGEPMFDLIEAARETLRAFRADDMEGEFRLPVYRGIGNFEVQGVILDAKEIRFALFAQIPRQTEEAQPEE